MTGDEALEAMRKLQGLNPDGAHQAADGILCELLCSLGYREVVQAFNAVEKWYA